MASSEPASSARQAGLEEWLSALSQSNGNPGGGAGAGVMLGIAAALTSMVAGYAEPEPPQLAPLEQIKAAAQQLRIDALRLADQDAAASKDFGAAFAQDPGPDREQGIARACLQAAESSTRLGAQAAGAIDHLHWLAEHGDRALIADVVVALGALRAAISGARANASFDLAQLATKEHPLQAVRQEHPQLWDATQELDDALARIDELAAGIDPQAVPQRPQRSG